MGELKEIEGILKTLSVIVTILKKDPALIVIMSVGIIIILLRIVKAAKITVTTIEDKILEMEKNYIKIEGQIKAATDRRRDHGHNEAEGIKLHMDNNLNKILEAEKRIYNKIDDLNGKKGR